jgi:outer membrane protein
MTIYRQYIDVIRKYQIIKIRKEVLEQGKIELSKSKALYEAGTTPKSNVYAQEAEIGSQEFELIRAENDYSVAKANLLTTMGLNPDLNADFLESSLPNSVSDEDVQNFRRDIGSFESALNTALKLRPDYFAAKEITESSNSNVTIATSGYYPRLTASGGWTWSNSEFDKFSELGRAFIGLSLNVPIFENFNTNQNIQSAKLKLKQSEVQQFQTEQNIRNALKTAFLNLDAAEKQLDITNRALKSAEMNYQSNLERYNLGATDVSVYIDANRQFITSQINRVSAIYSYFQAQKEVLYAIGKIDN